MPPNAPVQAANRRASLIAARSNGINDTCLCGTSMEDDTVEDRSVRLRCNAAAVN